VVRRPDWMGNRSARRILVEDYMDPETREAEPPDMRVSYKAYLIRNGGRAMQRALLRAEQRYERDKRALTDLSRLRRAYARRSR
jgi:hypothetical protein